MELVSSVRPFVRPTTANYIQSTIYTESEQERERVSKGRRRFSDRHNLVPSRSLVGLYTVLILIQYIYIDSLCVSLCLSLSSPPSPLSFYLTTVYIRKRERERERERINSLRKNEYSWIKAGCFRSITKGRRRRGRRRSFLYANNRRENPFFGLDTVSSHTSCSPTGSLREYFIVATSEVATDANRGGYEETRKRGKEECACRVGIRKLDVDSTIRT